jgi:hypothetical protein
MKNTLFILFLAFFAMVWSGCSKKNGIAGLPAKQIIGTDATNNALTLKLSWLPGKHYTFRSENVVYRDLTLPESSGTQTVVSALSQEFSLSALAPTKDGVQELDMKITAQRFFFQWNEKNYLPFDSRESAAQDAAFPMFPELRQLLNVPFKCFVGEDGTLIRTEGLDILTAHLQEGDPQWTNVLATVLSEKSLKIMFDALNGFLPGTPVKVGDVWSVHLEINPHAANNLFLDGQNTFTNWETLDSQQCIHTECQGNLSPNAVASEDPVIIQVQGGTLSSEGWFDPQLGMLVRSSTVEQLNGTISAKGQTLPAQINTTANFRLLDVED